VGYWPLLLQPANESMSAKLTSAFSKEADDSLLHPLCDFQCEYRWWFRSLFLLSLLAGVFTFSMLSWRCELRRRWDRWVKVGAALVGVLFLALLGCDPALAPGREHGALVMLLIVALVVSALWNWLKPRVKPP
jgi:peptidoglycan/LPS O-acetylase OafA/YrhL